MGQTYRQTEGLGATLNLASREGCIKTAL